MQHACYYVPMKKGKNKKRAQPAKGKLAQSIESRPTKKKGGGVITLEVYTDDNDDVTSYRMAYINPLIFNDDNGRVLGYDNAHGEHHRHYFGNYEPIEFDSIEAVIDRFYGEWMEIVNEHNPYQR